eukprot:scaffold27240_cov64-Phaeocystis_antarctica.AAC.7
MFGAVHKKLKDVGKDETTRGESLRELKRFFKKYDEEERYAGLRRIADDDGTAVWTLLKDTEVAAQLEKRAGERRVEDVGAAPELALANCELQQLKAENERLKDAAKGALCGLLCGLC